MEKVAKRPSVRKSLGKSGRTRNDDHVVTQASAQMPMRQPPATQVNTDCVRFEHIWRSAIGPKAAAGAHSRNQSRWVKDPRLPQPVMQQPVTTSGLANADWRAPPAVGVEAQEVGIALHPTPSVAQRSIVIRITVRGDPSIASRSNGSGSMPSSVSILVKASMRPSG